MGAPEKSCVSQRFCVPERAICPGLRCLNSKENTEPFIRRCSSKEVFLKISYYSHKSLFNEVAGLQAFFYRTPLIAASENKTKI